MDEQMESPPSAPAPLPVGLPKGLAIASMVLGIVSLVIFCAWPLSIPCAIVGLILGLIAGGKAKRGERGGRGMAKAGVITSTIAIVLAVLFIGLQVSNFMMRQGRVWEEPPHEKTVPVQNVTQTEQDQPAQEEPQQIEPGQEHAPPTGTED